jgi:hypothetical protein
MALLTATGYVMPEIQAPRHSGADRVAPDMLNQWNQHRQDVSQMENDAPMQEHERETEHILEKVGLILGPSNPGFSASAWLDHPPINIPEIQSQEFEYLSKAGL